MNSTLSSSWLSGSYADIAGFEVCINTALSYVSIDSLQIPEASYFFQGNEAEEVIEEMFQIWSKSDLTQEEAIAQWISFYL
mgnify:FL=1